MGHDFWLDPELARNSPETASALVSLKLGELFDAEGTRPFRLGSLPRLELHHQNALIDLRSPEAEAEAEQLDLQLNGRGVHVLVLDGRWSYLELPAERFNAYLIHEGLDTVLSQRRESGQSEASGRERYRRHLKAEMQVGESLSDSEPPRTYGQELELIPLCVPSNASLGSEINFRLEHMGRPLPGALVHAVCRSDSGKSVQEARTNQDGVAEFEAFNAGKWLVRTVHMVRCDDDPKADWQSHWAAYSFELGVR